jgi:hypothetical protein
MADGADEDDLDGSARDGSRAASRSRSASISREQSPAQNSNEEDIVAEGGESLKVPPRFRVPSGAPSPAPETQGSKADVDMAEDRAATPLDSVEEGEASDGNDLMED